LGTLVPTIGLVQVGAQSMADRYTYIPGIGLFLLLVWGLDDLLSRIPQRRSIATGLALAVSAACLALTHAQIASWQDSETLFTHAIDVTTAITPPTTASAARSIAPAKRTEPCKITSNQ